MMMREVAAALRDRRAGSDLSRLRLGPRIVRGRKVVLRQPQFGDYAKWRRVRLRDRRYIEPFWVSSDLEWADRHTKRRWIRECIEQRKAAGRSHAVSLVIEVDGRLAGQCAISALDHRTRSGELGVWVDSELAHEGVSGLASAMLVDHMMNSEDLDRVTAPICVDNEPALRSVAKGGMYREAVMRESFDAGGRRRDHQLWAATRDRMPDGGYADYWLAHFADTDIGALTPVSVQGHMRDMLVHFPIWFSESIRHVIWDWRAGRARRRQLESLQIRTSPGSPVVLRREVRARHDSPSSLPSTGLLAEVDGVPVMRCEIHLLHRPWATADLSLEPLGETTSEIAGMVTAELLSYAFEVAGMLRVCVAVPVDDQRIAVALEYVGLLREGKLHSVVDSQGRRGDHELWAVTKSAWGGPVDRGNGAPRLIV
ncbi:MULTISPECIES: GNAT family N-acetyltransferase [Gordonia]|uniref:GNAT family N-acetyltransferase n=1 Tax=Gordonia tangerina TaxID=2911060 RepID=A0ABS9DPE5_9ACTN|nr:GNAT family protein [Gordonia tangerina]MCF3940139.1 GNAT family N-acetyltransferase [Gordonia tangerina]